MSVQTEPHPSANGDLVNRVQQLRLDTQLGAAKAGRGGGGSWLPWVLCGLLALSWAGVGVRWYRAASVDRPDGGAAPAPSGTAPPAPSAGSPPPPAAPPGELMFQLNGTLIPSLQIAVSPVDVAGEVTAIFFKEGDRVTKGQKLAVIRDTRYRNEFNTAEATYRAAVQRKLDLLPAAVRVEEKAEMQAQIDEAVATRLQASQEFERTKAQRAVGAVSPQDLEKAEANLKTAEARVTRLRKTNELLLAGSRKEKVLAAEADIAAAKARLDEADRLLQGCVIKAPIDGTVLTKKADVGSLLNPLAFSSTTGGASGSLCEIADLSKLEVEVDVPERQILKALPKLDCQIAAAADPTRTYRGFVDRVMPIADDSKSVVKVRVRVVLPKGEDPGAFLKPKMSAVATAYNRPFAPQPTDQPWE